MILLGNFLHGLAVVADLLLSLVLMSVFISVILSWVNADRYNPLVRMITGISDPVLNMVRRYMPRLNIGLDLSPFLVIVLVYFLKAFLVGSLNDYAVAIVRSATTL